MTQVYNGHVFIGHHLKLHGSKKSTRKLLDSDSEGDGEDGACGEDDDVSGDQRTQGGATPNHIASGRLTQEDSPPADC